MANSLINILEEQSTFSFTGRINVLKNENGQFLGTIFQKDGLIVDAEYKGNNGKKALFNLVFDDIGNSSTSKETNDFKYIVEPEVIDDSKLMFEYNFADFYKKVHIRFQIFQEVNNYRPNEDLYLQVNPNFISDLKGKNIDPEEFETLCGIIKWSKVLDLYKNSKLYDFQITRALVFLRSKKAIIVSA